MDARVEQGPVVGEFCGVPAQFFGLVLRGSLLQIPTFGFYRFWLLTDVRRHLWSNTRVGFESFEYTGLGRELLTGFLMALAILAPVYFIYFLIGLEAERLQAFASLPLLLFLYFFGQYAAFRARRYRATRTVFRGMRFWMTGSGWAYAGRAILWDALTVLSLGLAFPWRAAALERYRMGNTHYGNLQASFVGTGWMFFKHGWWLWLIGMAALLAAALTAGVAAVGAMTPGGRAAATVIASLAPLVAITIIALVVWPLFRTVQLRWRFDGIRFGDVALRSDLTSRSIFFCYLKAWVAGLVFVLALGVLVGAPLALLRGSLPPLLSAETGTPSLGIIAALVLSYLFVLTCFGIIKLHFVDRGVWAAAAGSITVFNLSTLDGVVARGTAAGSVGEGLADALDVGGF
jgi:uncharacterized membrane protein YjgN (DUF898 family)